MAGSQFFALRPRFRAAQGPHTGSMLDRVVQVHEAGETAKALSYEVADMEKAVAGIENTMHLAYTQDVMDIMTQLRKEWGLVYPEEV